MTNYWSLSDADAAAALQEFLDERGPALEQLHEAIRTDGQDPHATLDYTVKSLRPLWAWVKSMVTESETAEMEVVTDESPSWFRYCVGNKPTLSREAVVIVDGLISYVCRVVERGAPRMLNGALGTSPSSLGCGRTTPCSPWVTTGGH